MAPRVITVCSACKPTVDELLNLAAERDGQILRLQGQVQEAEHRQRSYTERYESMLENYRRQGNATDALFDLLRAIMGFPVQINIGARTLGESFDYAREQLERLIAVQQRARGSNG